MRKLLLPILLISFSIGSNLFAQSGNEQNEPSKKLPADFPVYKNTGNVELDETNYRIAKEQWISTHKDQYAEMNGVVVEAPKEVNITVQNIEPFVALRSYRLIKIEAIAALGMKPSKEAMDAESDNIKIDFPEQITQLEMGENNQVRLWVENRLDFRAVEKRNLNSLEWYAESKTCESCSKTLYLSMEEESADTLVYILNSEDEGALYSYKMVFNLINNN